MRGVGGCGEGVFDALADGILLAVGAVQVDLVRDAGAVPGPGGGLGGVAGGVQPRGRGGAPQVAGTAGERGGGHFISAYATACQYHVTGSEDRTDRTGFKAA
jgi:hypothetical protein